MKNLELIDIAGYLPNGLPIKILNYKSDYVGIEFSKVNGYYFLAGHLHVTYDGGSTGKSNNDFIPILHPLSDLEKEIEIDGKKITPINTILEEYNSLVASGEPYTKSDLSKYPKYWEHWAVEMLYKWHFDIHGLIEKGLAIDINTLNL
jgi:hypothetical protein